MNAVATGGSVVKGPLMVVLKQYVATASPEEVKAKLKDWTQARQVMLDTSRDLELASGKLPEAFQETSLTTEAATRAFREASERLSVKVSQLDAAISALTAATGTTKRAQDAHKQLEANLPPNHGPAPDPSAPEYAQSGPGIDTAKAAENKSTLDADRAAHAARERAIADAERAAAEEINLIDQANYTAEPPVREITDEPNTESNTSRTSPSSPGSYSQIAASQARISKINSNTLYPEGWGHEIIAQEKANIEAHQAENQPEWDGNQWINADGSPAPSTSYAMVETANGLAPLAGGTGGMTAMAVAGGGALLTAGVAKALASKFAAGGASAKAAAPAATSRSAAARSGAAARGAGAAGARGAGAGAGARGAGSRAAGAGARGAGAAGGRGAGRAGAGGRGAGAGGRRGDKKRDENGSQNHEWAADYTDDWTETASDVLDPGAARGWVPNPPADGGENGPRQSK